VTSAAAVVYQVATNSGESSVQCEAYSVADSNPAIAPATDGRVGAPWRKPISAAASSGSDISGTAVMQTFELLPEVDAAAEELNTLYQAFVPKMVDLLSRIETIDAKSRVIREAKPYRAKQANGDGRYLLETELVARGLRAFGVHDQQIMKELKLPDWTEPAELAWPPPPPPIDYSSITPMRSHPAGDWWQVQQAEAARKREQIEKREEELRREEGRSPALLRPEASISAGSAVAVGYESGLLPTRHMWLHRNI
jgi:hypothetical protein